MRSPQRVPTAVAFPSRRPVEQTLPHLRHRRYSCPTIRVVWGPTVKFLGDGRSRARWGTTGRAPDELTRVLYVRTEGRAALSRDARRAAEQAGRSPRRVLVEEAFGFDLLGESDIRLAPGMRGRVLRALPMFVALGWEAARRSKEYDVVLTWAEKYTVGVAAALLLRRRRPPHVAILDWVSKPVVRLPLRAVRGAVDEILTWSSVQADAAVRLIGFEAGAIHRIEHPVDEEFFTPAPRETAARSVVSAGETQRDFATLLRAVEGTGVRTIVAADRVGELGGIRTRLVDAHEALGERADVSIGPLDPRALREAYASAAAIVVPLVESDNNAGISVILEAMAMGRPVIATRTVGQVDVIEDGVNGLYVRPGDAADLREKILHLRDHPDVGDEIGRRGRDTVLALHRTSDFVAALRSSVEAAAGRSRVRR